MLFPKTHLNDFISSDYGRTSEKDDYDLFNNVCYRTAQASVPTETQISIKKTNCESQE